jgi:hypothetical protein
MKRYQKALREGLVVDENAASSSVPAVSDGDVTCTGAVDAWSDGKKNQEYTMLPKIVDPGPMPHNIYDYGIIENWRDILFPRSLRREAIERSRRAIKERGISPPLEPLKPKAS